MTSFITYMRRNWVGFAVLAAVAVVFVFVWTVVHSTPSHSEKRHDLNGSIITVDKTGVTCYVLKDDRGTPVGISCVTK